MKIFKNNIEIKLSGQVYLNGRRVMDIESDDRIYLGSNFYTKDEFEALIQVFDKVKRTEFPKV